MIVRTDAWIGPSGPLAQESDRLIHRSDRGVQHLSIRYTERLAEAGIEHSADSK
jgi:transposase InsO family protein